MKVILRSISLLILCFWLFPSFVYVQRGGDGGLVIRHIFVDGHSLKVGDDKLLNSDGTIEVDIQHVVLNKEGKAIKELPDFTDAKYFDVSAPAYHLLYLPPYIRPIESKNGIPHQRLILEFNSQEMVIDFKDILLSNPAGDYNLIECIIFKPGHYVVHMNLQPFAEIIQKDDVNAWQEVHESLRKGINTGNNTILYQYGILEYWEESADNAEEQVKMYAPTESRAWLKLRRIGADSISLFVNGLLLSDGACNANVLLNMQKMQGNEWTDFHANWMQMDCGQPSLFANHEGRIINVYTLNVPGTLNPLPSGEYRYVAYSASGEFLVSESFVISESVTINPSHYKYLERQGFGMHGMDVQPNQIFIRTPYEPEILDGIPHYFFSYYHISDMLKVEMLQQKNPDEYYYKQLCEALRVSTLQVNNQLFTGKLKLELRKLDYAPDKKYLSNDLYIIDYQEGKVLDLTILSDVNLDNEQRRIR